MKLSYETARKMSIWIWEIRVKEGYLGYDKERELLLKKWGIAPLHFCGFCQFFHIGPASTDNCHDCPMYWPNPVTEDRSTYHDDKWPCSRNYWHWAYWESPTNKARSCYWARKVLAELQATPEHLPK